MRGWRRELQTVSDNIVALCYERARLRVLQRLAELELVDERRELLKLGKCTV